MVERKKITEEKGTTASQVCQAATDHKYFRPESSGLRSFAVSTTMAYVLFLKLQAV